MKSGDDEKHAAIYNNKTPQLLVGGFNFVVHFPSFGKFNILLSSTFVIFCHAALSFFWRRWLYIIFKGSPTFGTCWKEMFCVRMPHFPNQCWSWLVWHSNPLWDEISEVPNVFTHGITDAYRYASLPCRNENASVKLFCWHLMLLCQVTRLSVCSCFGAILTRCRSLIQMLAYMHSPVWLQYPQSSCIPSFSWLLTDCLCIMHQDGLTLRSLTPRPTEKICITAAELQPQVVKRNIDLVGIAQIIDLAACRHRKPCNKYLIQRAQFTHTIHRTLPCTPEND